MSPLLLFLLRVPRLPYSPTPKAPRTMSSYGPAVLGRLLATAPAGAARRAVLGGRRPCPAVTASCRVRSTTPALTCPALPSPPLPADGTVPFLSGERIAFSYLTSQKFTGEMATLDVLRDGQPMRLEIKVGRALHVGSAILKFCPASNRCRAQSLAIGRCCTTSMALLCRMGCHLTAYPPNPSFCAADAPQCSGAAPPQRARAVLPGCGGHRLHRGHRYAQQPA